MRIQFQNTRLARFLLHPVTKVFLALLVLVTVTGASLFTYYYVRFARLIDRRLSGDVFARTSKIFAAPEAIFTGQELTASDLTGKLRRAGYTENKTNGIGWYQTVDGGVEIFPGPESYFKNEPALARLFGAKVQRIISLKDNTEQQRYELEPELITNLFDHSREKRRLVAFEDLPPDLVNALLAAEDKSFFQHPGFDFARILKVAYEDIRTGTRAQGASTLTMQLARTFFLTDLKTKDGVYVRTGWNGFKRKLAETLIALQLEQRLTKQQIFEFYCNQVYMGQRGSFSLHGMGEASLAYFGKEVRQLSLPEAAFLAGIIRGPNIYNPYRYADRAKDRRNRILEAMARNGAISSEQRDTAIKMALGVVPPYVDSGDAPYFVDLLREDLLQRYSEKELVNNGYRIYTTLDMNLQRAATEAVRVGMKQVDEQLGKRKSKTKQAWPEAQVALVCIDAHSGDIKALLGGRYYGTSQLNRAMALRQPGSAFKPFVYAAAFNSALDGSKPVVTPVTVVEDSPTTFVYDGGIYEPNNYRENFRGNVTARTALALSLNVATVKIGEMVGFDRVSELARQAGLRSARATPSVALGSYEASPLDVAGAYTIFANGGVRVNPFMVRLMKRDSGEIIEEHKAKGERVLDPRVSYLMTYMMEGVIQAGTGAGVRARGFSAPAAGKTGTSHDGWFAGYTSNLLCIVWVGFDDNRELPLSGSQSALPVWTEFMKRAAALRQYRGMVAFPAPPGLSWAELDPASGQLATASCPQRRPEVFIEGSQPTEYCSIHSGLHLTRPVSLLGNLFGIGRPNAAQPAATGPAASPPGSSPPARSDGPDGSDSSESGKKKPGFFGRVFGVFKGGDKNKEKAPEKRPDQ